MLVAPLFALVLPLATSGAQFGDVGVVVPSGQVTLSYERTVWPASSGRRISGPVVETTMVRTSVSMSPHLQYFIAEDVAVGVGLLVRKDFTSDSFVVGVSRYGLTPSLAYNVRLSETVSLLPGATAALLYYGRPETLVVATAFSAPLLFHVAPHFFMGLGPSYYREWTSVTNRLAADDPPLLRLLQLGTTLGGYF